MASNDYFEQRKNLYSGIFLTVISIIYLVVNFIQPIGFKTDSIANSRLMPTIVGFALLLVSLIITINAVIGMKKAAADKKKAPKDINTIGVIKTFALVALYYVLMGRLGFIISTGLYLFLQVSVLSDPAKHKYLKCAIFAVVVDLIAYFVFSRLFSLPLPNGFLPF